jgi:hypothetical protein
MLDKMTQVFIRGKAGFIRNKLAGLSLRRLHHRYANQHSDDVLKVAP